jgi:hypothetical protein
VAAPAAGVHPASDGVELRDRLRGRCVSKRRNVTRRHCNDELFAHVLGEGDVPQGVEQENAGLKVTFHKQGKYWTVRLHPRVLFGQFSGDALHRKPGYPHQAQPARTAVCGPACAVEWEPPLIELGGSFSLRRHTLEFHSAWNPEGQAIGFCEEDLHLQAVKHAAQN